MTDAQFSILIATIATGLGGLGAVIRWSVSTLTKALDKNTSAHLESVKAMTEMSTKLDFVYQATGRVDAFVKEEISGVHDAPAFEEQENTPVQKPHKKRPGTYHLQRPKSEPGEK